MQPVPPKKSTVLKSWDKFLNPASLRQSFLEAAVFIAAYEVFEDNVIERPRSFFSNTFENGQWVPGPDYQTEVRNLHKKVFPSSLLWLIKMGAIDHNDFGSVMRLRDYRNSVVHELFTFVSSADKSIEPENYRELYRIISKIDQWWIREIEIPTNPDFDDADHDAINYEGIQSGNMMMFQIMFSIIDDTEFLEKLYKQFNEKMETSSSN
jgi:hypothetical protein